MRSSSYEATDIGRGYGSKPAVRAVTQADEARCVPGDDGQDRAVGRAVRRYRASLPEAGNGRPPVGLERMLRMYFVQHWFNLADAACEDALLDSTALRRFVGIDLGRERVPDATTMLKFRRRLGDHKLAEAQFAKVGEVLQTNGS